MPHHFPLLKAQIAADVVAVLSEYPSDPPAAPVVRFGQPRKPIRTYPHAVVRATVERELEGRSVEESYGFDIDLRLPPPDPQTVDTEEYLFAVADELIMRLAPFAPDGVPIASGPYAGVGYLRQVVSVTPGDDADSDPFCSVKVGFSVRTTVYQ